MNDGEFKADVIAKTAAAWTSRNPYLSKGDLGIESDTGRIKVGVGQRWSDTLYAGPLGITTDITIGTENLVFTDGVLTAVNQV